MSSPVCEANRGSGEPASRRGWLSSAKRLFRKFESRKVCEAATLILAEPLRLRHLPYPRSARQRRTLLRCCVSIFCKQFLSVDNTHYPRSACEQGVPCFCVSWAKAPYCYCQLICVSSLKSIDSWGLLWIVANRRVYVAGWFWVK